MTKEQRVHTSYTATSKDASLRADAAQLHHIILETGIDVKLKELKEQTIERRGISSVLWVRNENFRLIWGNHFVLDDHGQPHVVLTTIFGRLRGIKKGVLHDWNIINVQINTYRKEIIIGKTIIPQREWRKDASTITDALVKAYEHPEKPPFR